jgi:hypothetical protein
MKDILKKILMQKKKEDKEGKHKDEHAERSMKPSESVAHGMNKKMYHGQEAVDN